MHRMIVWHHDVFTGSYGYPSADEGVKILTSQQWTDHDVSVSNVTFWLFWPMVASNALWIAGGLLLLRRTRGGESEPNDKPATTVDRA
jgi:hypothetical protein